MPVIKRAELEPDQTVLGAILDTAIISEKEIECDHHRRSAKSDRKSRRGVS
ncbi:hypothetical protein PILCRDRAFT_815336, partial [Piloderma croceum F 1598]